MTPLAYAIRPFHATDAEPISQLIVAAIREIGSQKYSDDQVEAWASKHLDPGRLRARAEGGSHILVAADVDDAPVAFALIEPDGHLDMLYCHPAHTRRGLAVELLASAEQWAARQGIVRLYTEASELARPAFERAGYAVDHRRDFEITGPNGPVAIHNYAMEKPLG